MDREQMRGEKIYLLFYRNKDSFLGERWSMVCTFISPEGAMERARRDQVAPDWMEIRESVLM